MSVRELLGLGGGWGVSTATLEGVVWEGLSEEVTFLSLTQVHTPLSQGAVCTSCKSSAQWTQQSMRVC